MISTRQAAKRLGISAMTLSRYIAAKKVPAPKLVELEGMRIHSWTEEDIEKVRKLLPNIPDGRKTRHQKEKKQTKTKPKSKP